MNLVIEEPWVEHANCVGEPFETFFPNRGESVLRARRLCMACTVRAECLDYALRNKIDHGFYGGMSEKQRRKLRRAS